MRIAIFIAAFFLASVGLRNPMLGQEVKVDAAASAKAVADLGGWLKTARDTRGAVAEQKFAAAPLTREDAARSKQLLWEDHVQFIRASRAAEMTAKVIELDGKKMKFESVKTGAEKRPSLFISMHGGGGAPPPVNESQWVNQVKLAKLYQPREGIYVAPRAPTDTWDLWHQAHIDRFFARLIEDMIVLENVNPNRVYILGYSAGGDGAYQLAPRMADRWAAAAMMAGHPNDASPLGLRNIGFAIQVGANDGAFNRNKVAEEWGKRLDDLQKADAAGYAHFTEVHKGKGHWMDGEDKKAIAWMEKFTRDPIPAKVVWHQDDVTHDEFYWLAVPKGEAKAGEDIVAERKGQTVAITTERPRAILVRLNDAMLDLDQPVKIDKGGVEVFKARAARTIGTLARTLESRGDPELMFSAEIVVGGK